MKSTNIFDLDQIGFRAPRGVHFAMNQRAADLGITMGELLRATFWLLPDERGILRLVVRQVGPEHIGVIGTGGRVIGTLKAVMEGSAKIDGPEDETRGPMAARMSAIVISHTDLERAADGTLTGRLSPSRSIRKPGRKRSVKLERARAAIDQLAGSEDGRG